MPDAAPGTLTFELVGTDPDGNTLVLSPSAVVLGKTRAVIGRTFRPILTGATA